MTTNIAYKNYNHITYKKYKPLFLVTCDQLHLGLLSLLYCSAKSSLDHIGLCQIAYRALV